MINKPSNTDPATEYRGSGDSPGALRAEISLTIQTRHAQRLITGRPKGDDRPAIMGLTHFASRLRQISDCARADDPYADWRLIKIQEELERSDTELKKILAELEIRLTDVDSVEIQVAQSLEPIKIPLQFRSPYAFRGAYLAATFDEVVRATLTIRHVGLMRVSETERLLDKAARLVRRAYSSPSGYKYFGITRKDVSEGNAKAQEAEKMMGPVPEEILTRKRVADYVPDQSRFHDLNAGLAKALAQPPEA